MRRIFCLLIIVMLMMSSCSKGTANGDSNADDGVEYPPADTSGMQVTYLPTQKGGYPVNISVGGAPALAGDVYYYNAVSTVEKDITVKQKTFTSFDDRGHNKGVVAITDVAGDDCKLEPYSALVTSGNWRLCPDMRVQSFDNASPPGPYLELLSESYPDSEFTIDKLYETDIDLDGTNEAVFTAKSGDTLVVAVLSQTLGNKILHSTEAKENAAAIPYFADFNGDSKPSLAVLCGSTLKTFTVYSDCSLDASYTLYLPIGA